MEEEEEGEVSSVCQMRSMSKQIVRAKDCLELGTHKCQAWAIKEKKLINYKHYISGNHYAFRFHQKFFSKSLTWQKYDEQIILLTDINEKYYSAAYDSVLAHRYHYDVYMRLFHLLDCTCCQL